MIDTADFISLETAKALYLAGHHVVGVYGRSDRTPLSVIENLHQAGIKVVSIIEKGQATSPDFFTVDNANRNADNFLTWAQIVGQPAQTTASPAFDYESTWDQVSDYMRTIHDRLKAEGFFNLPYGDGITLQKAIDEGFAVGGWLSESSGFDGYYAFKPKAAIVQRVNDNPICGLNCDLDDLNISSFNTGAEIISVTW